MIKKNDVVLAVALLVVALAVMLILKVTQEEGGTVVVKVQGEEYATYSLSEDRSVTIGEPGGEFNILEIKDGRVSMTEASCPDKLCVKHRSIHYNSESIVCLPNKTVVEIQDGEENHIDFISR